MTRQRNESNINATERNELASTPTELVTDGGEEPPEYDDVRAEFGEEHVEYYPDGFVSGEPVPDPTAYPEEHTDEIYVDSHLQPGYDDGPDPAWGYEDGSARPRGPPCRDCGEDMTADSFGWAPDTGQTVDCATCEDCGLGWGPITGWVNLDSDEGSEPVPDGGLEHTTTEGFAHLGWLAVPEWVCPECGGGFPTDFSMQGLDCRLTCPWCLNQGVSLIPDMPAELPEQGVNHEF